MVTARKIMPTPRDKFVEQLQPFLAECARRGCPLEDVDIEGDIPGTYQYFVIRFIADWSEKNGIDAVDTVQKILKEVVPHELRKKIVGIVPSYSPDVAERIRQRNLAEKAEWLARRRQQTEQQIYAEIEALG